MAQITLKVKPTTRTRPKIKKSEKEDCIMLIIKERTVAFEVETRDWCDA